MCGSDEFTRRMTVFFKAMGNENRQQIVLNLFSDGMEHNITEVAAKMRIANSTASEHLSFLKRADILSSRKVEKEVFYRLNPIGIIAMLDGVRDLVLCKGDTRSGLEIQE